MKSLQGQLLIANGSLFGAEFRQTVILMAEHNEEGALGFVLNHPTPLSIEADGEIPIEFVDRRVFSGGPVQEDAVAVIAEFESPEHVARPIFDLVGFPSPDPVLSPLGVKRARVFAGYSGWGPGQLDAEMAEGSWIVAPATADLVFEVPPEDLWAEVLRRKGGQYALMASMPYDPSIN